MSRKLNRLNVKQVASYRRRKGQWADGGNLFLKSDGLARFSWLLIYKSPVTGRQRSKGLGSAAPGQVSLDEARRLAAAAREHLRAGRDPIEEERTEEAKRSAEARKAKVPTFGQLCTDYLETHRRDWTNPKHVEQWEHGLTVHAAKLAPLPVDQITRHDVLETLKPIWTVYPETAQRLRARLHVVFDGAVHDGWISTNPAAWGGLKDKLAKPAKLVRGHHPSLPHSELPQLMAKLKPDMSGASRLLQLVILTASRQGEMRGLKWSEIDFERRVIEIPAARMKMKRAHRIPLSDAALAVLREMLAERIEGVDLVFVSFRGKPYSDAATMKVLRRHGYGHITTHGFRSSFRDWSAERTDTPFEAAELCLAHHVASHVARAYLRTDLMERRRHHMQGWAHHCAGVFDAVDALVDGLATVFTKSSNVIPLRPTAA